MKQTVEALKDLYVKLGGSSEDEFVNIPDAIDAITEVAEKASSELVATENNGTVTISVR